MGTEELHNFRLQQVEERLKAIDAVNQAVTRDQLKFRLDHDRIAKVETQLGELRDEAATWRHLLGRLDHLLKALLGGFGLLVCSALVWIAKQGGLG